ncbi:RNA-directed DNA polymerase from mobile element jockey [Araneus ventricosus]|uniref:RNA-directed DNA polymerase from mobile element jockey n=1 Tax=Araneus ventricosus TaxID=182803 RepID=A0A4Y2GJ30_ARAVE|nr:RNA-directed DNA polymerase from mobile element jockey [Araneus ventricosus]
MGHAKKGPFSGQQKIKPTPEKPFDSFFIIKRLSADNESFNTVSPFLVQKAITATVGEVAAIKKLRSGDLLVEVSSRQQALQILKIKVLGTIPISVTAHATLNHSKGVITCGELLNVSVEEITRELSSQGVTHVRRITIRRDGQLLDTKHHIITFHFPTLPEFIYAGYIKLPVRAYIPNPLRCFKCQRFGHSQGNCRGTLTCARCAEKDHDTRRKVLNTTPTTGLSYAAAAAKTPSEPKNKPSQLPPVKSSDSDSDKSVLSVPDASNPKKKKSRSKNSFKLKLAKRGLSQKDMTSKFQKSATKNSVALGLATQGLVHKDLPSIFGGVPKSPDRIALHPSEGEDEEITMSCDVSPTRTKTFLASNIPLKLRGYNCVRKDTDTGSHSSGGVCILTSNLYPSTPLTLHTTLQAVAVQVHTRALVTVCCIYLPPHDVITQQQLNNLVDQVPKPFLLLGDFNGHSALWGSDNTNSRGRQIEQFISNNCLCLLNNDEKTYFHEPTRSFHSLDLAICSPDLLPLLNFEVGDDLHNSDHFPLIVSHADSGGAIQLPPRYLFQRADWAAFMQLAGVTEAMVSTADISEAVQHVVDIIINAADNTIPKSSPRLRKFRRPWWNAACRDSYRKQRKCWNVFRRYPTTENLVAFKRARAFARRIRRRSQRESWIQFVSSITSSTSSKHLWKKVKAANGVYKEFSIPVLNTGHASYSSPLDVANILGQTFAQVSAADSYNSSFVAIKNRAERMTLNFSSRRPFPYNSEFRMFELKAALSKAHDSSPGPDGIAYSMLRHLNAVSLSNLLYLFNRVWREQSFPRQWQEAVVIPILKPGKDPANPLHYRPIALTSVLCKTLERMVNARLVFELEKQGCIPPLQSGFRRGRSTFDNIVHLETQIRNAFVRRNHLVSIFFDVEKAYDRTWRHGILRKLYNLGFKGNLPLFIKRFLSSRTFRVRLGNFYSDPFNQVEGVPQGSVLSVTLFILHFSEILNHLPLSVTGTLYVDDLQISCQGCNLRLIERQLQNAISKIVSWCDENGHTLSAEKSKCVHFCRKRGIHLDPILSIRNDAIPIVDEIRFLGVIFDRKLTFLPHILQLRKKCEKSLNILKVLSCTSWGADRTSLLRIYQAVILSRIDYGCFVYGSARSSALRRLDTVHHSALRICSGAFRTSPVESLYTICHQLPLHLRRKKLSLQYYFRALSHSQHPTSHMTLPATLRRIYNARPSHILPFCERVKSIIQDSEFNFPDIQTVDFQIFPPWNIPQFSFLNPFSGFDKSKTSPVIYQQLFSFHRSRYSSYRPIFTDGSKAVGHVGCGIIFDADISSFRLHTSFSILSAELVAIFYALQKISLSFQRQFCIYTDSMSSLETLCHPHFQMHPVAMEILGLLQTLQHRGFCILFCWIPSHVGIAGNEQADHSAKTAASLLHREIPYCDVKKSVARCIFFSVARDMGPAGPK